MKATEGQESMGIITNFIDETLSGIRLIKAFTARNAMIKKFVAEVKRYANISVSVTKRVDLAGPVSEVLGIIVVSGILYIGGVSVLENSADITASQFITFIIVFARILQPAKAVANSYSLIQRGLASGDRVFELIDIETEIKDKPGAIKAPGISQSFELKNVSFTYENDTQVLTDINLRIPKGKMVALVGPSGGGKSTIADLVPRFYDPESGQVMMDGVDIKSYTLESLRKQMGIVTQESILFNDTIFNNIAFGIDEPDEDLVIQAAKIANAHDFIMQTSEGYQTNIGEHGAKLSGGQRQRLSIARAIMKNPPILVLDEATSALDSESEKLVQDALTKLMSNRTSLVIAHRLSTIQHADEIIVIDKGKVTERGTHEDLLKKEGIYKKLSLIQKG
jgi:subfamily B ATP-binding cassette protein MsbA